MNGSLLDYDRDGGMNCKISNILHTKKPLKSAKIAFFALPFCRRVKSSAGNKLQLGIDDKEKQ